jgi:hypothetical protein
MRVVLLVIALQFTPFGAQADSNTDQLLGIMRCACDDAGERVFSRDKTLLDPGCTCALGESMRARIQAYMKLQSVAEKQDKSAQVTFLDQLMTEDPANERYLIYPKGRHKKLMENTACTCGCGMMALSQCPLDCPWSPVYQRRFKVLLGLGMDNGAVLANYLKHANKVHRQGKTAFALDDIILNQEKPLSWMVPVVCGVFAVLIFAWIVIRRTRLQGVPVGTGAMPADPALSVADREMLSDELDDIGG